LASDRGGQRASAGCVEKGMRRRRIMNPQVYKMMMSPQQYDGSANPFTILNPKQLLYYLFLTEAPGSQIHCLGH